MEGIEFEKENYGKPIGIRTAPKQSWAIKLVKKAGGKYVKSDEQATLIIIGLTLIFFVLAIYNFTHVNHKPKVSKAEQAASDALMQQELQAAKNHK